MSFENVSVEISEGIGVLTINRPKALNALNEDTLNEIEAALEQLEGDAAVSAVIITGAGDKSFIAGADIRELSGLDATGGRESALRGQSIFDRIEAFDKPVVAAVNGFCLGGGCELALACHLRVASENARFGQPEVKLGLVPGYGGSQRLPRLVGKGRALEMLLTGEMISAEEAYRIGLANRVVPADQDLMETARELCGSMLKNGPLALRLAIRAVNEGMDLPLERGLELEAALFGLTCGSADGKEGTQAFLEKRKPSFSGK